MRAWKKKKLLLYAIIIFYWRNFKMNINEFVKEFDDIVELSDRIVRDKLELLVNAPMTYEGFVLAYAGILFLVEKCGENSKDERFREAAYKRVIKMLENESEPTDSETARLQADYAMSLLSHFMDPPVPEQYSSRLKQAAQKFYRKVEAEYPGVKPIVDELDTDAALFLFNSQTRG
ncbi:hypothetical protein JXA85_01045 [Candidatus Woesearchaeota archaeon]|nr:hypothetical protein [Candidatus Woesearchaeota archaeon]